MLSFALRVLQNSGRISVRRAKNGRRRRSFVQREASWNVRFIADAKLARHALSAASTSLTSVRWRLIVGDAAPATIKKLRCHARFARRDWLSGISRGVKSTTRQTRHEICGRAALVVTHARIASARNIRRPLLQMQCSVLNAAIWKRVGAAMFAKKEKQRRSLMHGFWTMQKRRVARWFASLVRQPAIRVAMCTDIHAMNVGAKGTSSSRTRH